MNTDLISQSPLYQEWIGAATQQGIEAGRAEGIEAGQLLAMRAAARIALAGRFGELSADLLAALDGAEMAPLTAILAHISTETLEQTRARLGLA